MKKHFLLAALSGAASFANAQSFPNGGFENWTNHTVYEDPQYWTSMNIFSMFGADQTVLKSTDAHTGTYAVKLATSVSDIGNDGEMDTIPGIAILGDVDLISGTGSAGHPFVHRPDSLVGWYKLISPDNTPFQLKLISSKWDLGSGSQEMIGNASFEGQPSSNYIRFSIPIDYLSTEAPDTLQVYLINSANETVVGNEVYLDDLSFVYNSTAGIEEQNVRIQMYPNPANELLTIHSDQVIRRISVNDLQGKQLFEAVPGSDNYQIQTGHFAPGTYFCELYFSNGSSKQMKFIRE